MVNVWTKVLTCRKPTESEAMFVLLHLMYTPASLPLRHLHGYRGLSGQSYLGGGSTHCPKAYWGRPKRATSANKSIVYLNNSWSWSWNLDLGLGSGTPFLDSKCNQSNTTLVTWCLTLKGWLLSSHFSVHWLDLAIQIEASDFFFSYTIKEIRVYSTAVPIWFTRFYLELKPLLMSQRPWDFTRNVTSWSLKIKWI